MSQREATVEDNKREEKEEEDATTGNEGKRDPSLSSPSRKRRTAERME